MWERAAKNITQGKNKGARLYPGSICRNEGYTVVTVEMKVYGKWVNDTGNQKISSVQSQFPTHTYDLKIVKK